MKDLYALKEAMLQYGGTFAKKIAEALNVADPINEKKLISTFKDLIESYRRLI